MKFVLGFLLFSTLVYPFQMRTQFISEQERVMMQSISKKDTVPFPMIQCMMLCEGETDTAKIIRLTEKLNKRLEDLDETVQRRIGTGRKVRAIVDFLRSRYLKKYNNFSLTEGLFSDGYYSNVTAAGLFYDVCSRYRIPIRVNSTSMHVYFTFIEENDTIRVEPCYSEGYDTGDDQDDFRDVLKFCNSAEKRYIDQKEFLQVMKEYQEFREVPPSYIVALRYFVDGNAFFETRDYNRSFLAYEKAAITVRNVRPFQTQYALGFYMFSDEETKAKEHYFALFERFIFNLGTNKEIIENNLARIERYAVYMRESRDYVRCQTMFEHLDAQTTDAGLKKKIAEMITKHSYFWAYNLFELGNYSDAFVKMQSVVAADSLNQRYLEASLKFTTRFATFQIEQGHSARAKELLDSVMEKHHTFPFVKEAYVKSMNNIVYNDNLLRDDPEEAIRILKRSNAYDPNNKATINLLASAHHNFALRKVKSKNYKEARAIVQEGLQFSPTDSYLKKDIEYLNKQEKK